MSKRVLIACEFSGIVREAFRAAGCDAWSCDLLPTEIPGQHIQGDVSELMRESWGLVVAHPPCTHLSSSGARWFKEKRADGRQQEAIRFFMLFVEAGCRRMAIENPIGVMSSEYRRPDQIIHPWQHGHPETKSTCLWLKGLPALVPTNLVSGRAPRVHHEPPSEDRWKNRSRTYPGIAAAMAAQWAPLLSAE